MSGTVPHALTLRMLVSRLRLKKMHFKPAMLCNTQLVEVLVVSLNHTHNSVYGADVTKIPSASVIVFIGILE
jgi:hypothetical protein